MQIQIILSGALAATAAATPLDTVVRVDVAGYTPSSTTFEGFGTSLCWWARGVGGWSNSTAFEQMMDLLFDPHHPGGLRLNQVRYNIGGGTVTDPELKTYRPGGWVPAYRPTGTTWDWTADAEQRRVLAAAKTRGVRYAMAFSNSPPAWMTVSGSATGSKSGTTDNLRGEDFKPFAAYLANVTAHFAAVWNTTFDSVTPLNEAANGWWKTGGSQEGCHFDQSSESVITAELGAALSAAGVDGVAVSGPEENSIDTSLQSLQRWSSDAIAALGVITTHTYNGDDRSGLAQFAAAHGKRMWASEYGTGSGPLQGGLQLAQRIMADLQGFPNLQVWTLWQAADLDNTMNVKGGWGLTAASYCGCGGGQSCQCSGEADGAFAVRKQFYALRQFSAFLVPASRVLHRGAVRRTAARESGDVVVATDPNGSTLVFAVNAGTGPSTVQVASLPVVGGCADHVLTDVLRSTEVVAQVNVSGGVLTTTLPPESVSTFILRSGSGQCLSPLPPAPAHIRLLNTSGLCLAATGADTLQLQPCGTAEGSDLWVVPASGGSGPVVMAATPPARAARCLAWGGESKPVTLEECAASAASQQWVWDPLNGALSGAGSEDACTWKWGKASCCLDDWNGGEHSGDAIYTYSCWGGNTQKWVLESQLK